MDKYDTQQRLHKERALAVVELYRGRYYCWVFHMKIDLGDKEGPTSIFPRLGFATKEEYQEFASDLGVGAVFYTLRHNGNYVYDTAGNMVKVTDMYSEILKCPRCSCEIRKPRGMVPGKDVYCPSCEGYFTFS